MNKRIFATLLVVASTLCGTAAAAPVTASYTGAVTGYVNGSTGLDTEFPLGTSVSWQFEFDDAFFALDATSNVFAAATQAVTGSLQAGGQSYTLNQLSLSSYRYDLPTNAIIDYGFQLNGVGPGVPGGDFFAMFMQVDPTYAISSPLIGFGFTTTFDNGFSVTNYRYLETTGEYRIDRATVPEPSTLGLMGAALALAGFARRRNHGRAVR